MSRKNKFLNWYIEKLVLWYNNSSYRKIKIEPDVGPIMNTIPNIMRTKRSSSVIRTNPEVVRKALDEWFENDIDCIIKGVRTFLNQDPPWISGAQF